MNSVFYYKKRGIFKKWFSCNEIHERIDYQNHSLLFEELSCKSAIPYLFGIAYGLKPGDTIGMKVIINRHEILLFKMNR